MNPAGVERRCSWHRKPIFARSCRSAQSGLPTAPREVHLPLLPHGPSGVHRRLSRRTRLRRSAGPEENRPVLLTFHRLLPAVTENGLIQVAEHPHFTRVAGNCQAKFNTYKAGSHYRAVLRHPPVLLQPDSSRRLLYIHQVLAPGYDVLPMH